MALSFTEGDFAETQAKPLSFSESDFEPSQSGSDWKIEPFKPSLYQRLEMAAPSIFQREGTIVNPDKPRGIIPNFAKAMTTPAVAIPRIKVNPDDSALEAVGKEAVNLAAGIPEFIESPAGVATGGAATVIPRTVAAAFGADTLRNVGKQIVESYKNWGAMTTAQKAAALTDIAGGGLLAAVLGKAASTRPKIQIESEAPNASNQQSSVEIPQPEIRPSVGQEAPLRQQPEEPAAAKEEIAQPEPNLQPVQQGLTPDKIAKLSPDNFVNYVQDKSGGLTGEAWRVGQGIKTPEELNQLKMLQEQSSANNQEAIKNKTPDFSHAMKGQFFREAYEAATGTGSAGFALKKQDPNYKPPFPQSEPSTSQSEINPEQVENQVAIPRVQSEPSQPVPVQKYRVGNNPTLHTVVEKLPASPVEVLNGEQPVKVRNDKTGEESTVLESDLTPVKEATAPKGKKQGLPEKLKALGYSDSEISAMDKLGQKALADRGIPKGEKPTASDWTAATTDEPTELYAGVSMPKFSNRKMSELDTVSSSHSAKLQKSFDEARRAQKEIKKAVPSESRQGAISLWIQAAGDSKILQDWESKAKGKEFKRAAKEAQTLTPDELAVAQKAIAAFDALGKRGEKYDVLKSFIDNYVPQVWKVKKPGTGFGGSVLKQRFKFAKARTFNNYFEGDQAGFIPRTLAIGRLLPAYIHEMNKVIADRQLVQDLTKSSASDGLPLAAPRGNVSVVDKPSGKAVLVSPRALKGDETADYKQMEGQPALSGWAWEGKDTGGNPVFVKADLALHPEAYRRLNAIIGKSAIREWANDPVSGMAAIPKAVVRGLDSAQSAMKREMFGLLAPFHQVQEGTHAIGHLVSPFTNIPKIDLRDPAQMDAAKHGLMLLPDRASSNVYLEGVGTKSSLLSKGIRKIPKVGQVFSDIVDGYQDYLFHRYIPGIKFKTYEAMLKRNLKLYEDEIKSGEMNEADVKITSALQANAAYGHLNYALMDRNPTIQHIMQLGLLAPDFLEARVRFVGQAAKGLSSKVGHEQFKAIAILAAVQAGSAFTISQLLGVPYDPKHPFEVIYNGRRYSMRSVPEDIYTFLKDRRQFIYSRVNPLTVRGGVQLATGLNYRGEKVDTIDTIGELLAGYIPLTARSLPLLRSLTETGRNSPVTPIGQLMGSLGLRVSRYSPISETYKLAGEWMDSQGIEHNTGSYPISKYQKLRYALEDGDIDAAKAEYDKLRKTMEPYKIHSGFEESVNHPFTSSKAKDLEFSKSLEGYDREIYNLAVEKRKRIIEEFRKMKK